MYYLILLAHGFLQRGDSMKKFLFGSFITTLTYYCIGSTYLLTKIIIAKENNNE